MKFIKSFLWCFLGLILAFLLMFLYKECKKDKDMPIITMNVLTGDLADNKLPRFEALTLSFPGDSYNEMYNCDGSRSNTIIKVAVLNATNEYGMISKLVFYYYNADDPSRILEFKEAGITNPYVYFSVPKIGGEYKFGVKLYDNNGGVIDSEEYLGSNPLVHIPSCSDAPIATLRLSNTDIEVGDVVTYTVISRSSMDSEDFEKNLTFYYDFTGDGLWDLMTGNNVIEYTFNESYPYGVRPRVAVEYKGKVGIGEGANIYVGEYNFDYE